jgi:deoxyribose-phosphate aldolase
MKTLGQDHATFEPVPIGQRNEGCALDLGWVRSVRINSAAVTRRAAGLQARRSVKGAHQAAWLCKAVACMDLTTLSGDDTAARVRRLCAKARQPVRADLLEALGMQGLQVGAVCVYHERTGQRVGMKPAGGISKAKDALGWLVMVKEELGDRWLEPDLFRFGASSLLGDIERQLEHHVTGAYSAGWRHGLA